MITEPRWPTWQSLVARRLSPDRYAHTLRVVGAAAELARQHAVDPLKARVAALFHDYAKELPIWLQRELAASFRVPEWETLPGPVLHGPIAAHLLPNEVGITDPDVLGAIARHTTAAPGLSRLDMVIYLADLLEPEHRFPGHETLRAAVAEDLETGMLKALEHSIRHLLDKGIRIDPQTLLARNELLVQRRQAG